MKREPMTTLLSVILLAGMLLCFGAGAAVAKTLTVGSASGQIGADVNLPITLDNPEGVGGVAFTLTFNSNVLEFKGLVHAVPPISDGDDYKDGDVYVLPGEGEALETFRQTLFYQYNDGVAGKVIVAAASAQSLANGALFNAKFNIKGGSGSYPVSIARSIIHNPAAGYDVPTTVPALVGMPAEEPTNGYYPTPIFAATLVSGTITVAAPGYSIGGTVNYEDGTPANGSTVTLRRASTSSPGTWVFDAQTTVSGGSYSFANKPNGTYKVSVTSNNPNFYNAESDVIVSGANQTANLILPAPIRVTGSINYIDGLRIRITNADGQILGVYAIRADGTFDIGPFAPGTYKAYAVYGSLVSHELTLGQANTWDPVLYSIGGTVHGLAVGSKATITAVSATGSIQKTMATTAADGAGQATYTIENLVPADDYTVSAVAAGLPVMYFDQETDITKRTAVDISVANDTTVDFNYDAVTKGTISGRVTDDQDGVEGIGVFAFNVNTFALASVITDGDGDYAFTLAPGTYEIFVIKGAGKVFYYAAGGATQNFRKATLLTVDASEDRVGKDIDIKEWDKILSGVVTYERPGGDPVENALIMAASADGESMAVAITGKNGAYLLTGLRDGLSYRVTMTPMVGNFAVQETSITAGTDTTRNFVIDTGNKLTGKVSDSIDSEQGIPGAMLYLTDQETGLLVGGRMYFSGGTGTYTIGDIAGGVYSLDASHPQYRSKRVANLGISQDTVRDVSLVKGAHFKGTVRDGSDGNKPLAGVTIIVTRPGETPLYRVTNNSGYYELYGLDGNKSDYIVMAQKRGYERQFVTAQTPTTAGTAVDFTLNLPAAVFNLSGTVTSGCAVDLTLPGAIVAVSSASKNFSSSTVTNNEGVYSFTNLPQSDDYRLVIVPGGGLRTWVEENLNFLGETTVLKNVEIPCGNAISGTITGKGGAITVYLFTENDDFVGQVAADPPSGAYSFTGLGAGQYKVLAVETGNISRWHGGHTLIQNATLVNAGATGVDINLQ